MQSLTKAGLTVFFVCLVAACSYLPDKWEVPGTVTVFEYRNFIEVNPTSNQYSKTGLVFYPGGFVDPHAYIGPLSKFVNSGKGHKVIIVKMPGNLAFFDPQRGAWIYEEFPDVTQWVISGHSLGGVMACSVVKKNPGFFMGLVLMASYPGSSNDLSDWTSSVLSMRGEFDGIVDSLTIASNASSLPEPCWIKSLDSIPTGSSPITVYYIIPGGNHSQFGNYGDQEGDGIATITREDQAELVATAILKFFIAKGLEYDK